MVWGERKEGEPSRVLDYELKLWGASGIMYVEPQVGEFVVGKVYDLTPKQVEATDQYEGGGYERVRVKTQNKDDIWIYRKA